MPNYNKNVGYGNALLNNLASQVPAFGRVMVVFDPDNTDEANYQQLKQICDADPDGVLRFYGSDFADGTTPLEQAYAAAESNNNDVIVLDSNSTHLLSGMLTVAKNRVHFFGMDGGGRLIQQGAKISLATAATDAAATITVTGTRCSFRNLKILNSGTHTNSVSAVIGDGDEGTLWQNCSFQKHSDLGESAVSNFECRSDSPTFIDCEFGFDTLTITAARANFLIKASGATRAKNIRMKDCTFTVASTSATASHILVSSTASLNFTNVFKDCVFLNSLVSTAAALNDAVTSVSSLIEGSMLFINPASESTEFCSAVTDQVKVVGSAVSAQAGEALTPS